MPAYQRNRVSPRAAAHFLFKRKKSCWPNLANSTKRAGSVCPHSNDVLAGSLPRCLRVTHHLSIKLIRYQFCWHIAPRVETTTSLLSFVYPSLGWRLKGESKSLARAAKGEGARRQRAPVPDQSQDYSCQKGGKKVNRSRREGASVRLARMAKHFDRLTLRC